MNLYEYSTPAAECETWLTRTTASYRRYQVRLPALPLPAYAGEPGPWGECYLPRSEDAHPLVIVVHGMGDPSVIPCRFMALNLARRGLAAFILYLPFHSSRVPEHIKGRFPALSSEEWDDVYPASVINVRQAIDWAQHQESINADRIGVAGVSLGGMISAIAMAVDPRIKAGVFMLSGGDWEQMTWKSWSRTARMSQNCSREDCRRIRRQYPAFLARVAETGLDGVTAPRRCFFTDPLTYGRALHGRPILMINALWDRIVPRQCAEQLWQACGEPAIMWLPATHITLFLWYPLIVRRMLAFLHSTL